MEPVVTFADPHMTLASWNGVMLVYFNGAMQPTHMPALNAARTQLIKANPTGIAMLLLVGENAAIPPANLRDEASASMRSMREILRASAYVMRGSGVGVTALRTLLSAMLLASRRPSPAKIFSDVPEATSWLYKNADSVLRAKNISVATLESTFNKFVSDSAARASAKVG